MSTKGCLLAFLAFLTLTHAGAQNRPMPAVEFPLNDPVKIELTPTAKAQCVAINAVRDRGSWQNPEITTTKSDMFVERQAGEVVLGMEFASGNMTARMMFPVGADGRLDTSRTRIDSNSSELKELLEKMIPSFVDSVGGGNPGTTFFPGKSTPVSIDPCKIAGATLRPGGRNENIALGYVTTQGRKGLLLKQEINSFCSTPEGVFDISGGGWWIIDQASGMNTSVASHFSFSVRGTVLTEVRSQSDCMIISQ